MNEIVNFIKTFDLHTIIVVGVAFFFLNSSIGSRLDTMDKRFNEMEKDILMIKTTLILKNIMPSEMAKTDKLE
jgi:hypothetical protein